MKELSSSGSGNLWTAVSMFVLGFVCIVIRLAVRVWARIPLTWSDWLIIAGQVAIGVYTAFIIEYVVAGPGPGTYDLNEIMANAQTGGLVWGTALMKSLYIGDQFFGLGITLVKLSILDFYRQLFAISKSFQVWNRVAAALCIAWLIAFVFLNAFQCDPPSALWEALGSTEYCMPSGPLWLGYEITNFALDVVLLVLPVAVVRHLKLRAAQKMSVAGIFLIGGLVCIASIVRMTYIWDPEAPETVAISEVMIISSIQLGTAVLCACLPTYGPLLNASRRGIRIARRAVGFSVPDSYGESELSGRKTKNSTQRSEYYRMGEGQSSVDARSASADRLVELGEIPSRSIMVSKSIQVT